MFKPQFKGHRETCFFCQARWGACTCSFRKASNNGTSKSDPGFNSDGFWITQPNLSRCTRFFIDPEVYYGQAWLDVKHLFKV